MSENRDTSVNWLGTIPSNWEVNRIKSRVAEHFGGCWGLDTGEGNATSSNLCIRIADFDFDNQKIKGTASTYRFYTEKQLQGVLHDGDIIVEKSGGGDKTPVGRTVLFTQSDYGKSQVMCVNFCECLRPKNVNPRFFAYILKAFYCSNDMRMYFNQTTGLQNLDIRAVLDAKVCFPPLTEQDEIAKILDEKCLLIESTSNKIKDELVILEEYKKSLIRDLVSKGIRQGIAYKDSGLGFIGKIPQDWKVEKIKYHLRREEPRNPGDAEILSVYREFGVIPKNSRSDNHNVTSEDTSNYKYVRPGDLVINKMKAWQGSMGVSEYEGVVSPAYFIYRFNDDMFEKRYVHYLLRSCYKDEFRRLSGGIREGQWDLSPAGFENTYLLIPSKQEQRQIIKILDKKCAQIEEIIERKKKQLEILTAYRKSLVFEYSTGKRRV